MKSLSGSRLIEYLAIRSLTGSWQERSLSELNLTKYLVDRSPSMSSRLHTWHWRSPNNIDNENPKKLWRTRYQTIDEKFK